MHIVHVHVQVSPGCEEAFAAASADNSANSLREPGVLRFDVVQQLDDPCRFVLVEVYRNAEDNAQHKQTAHYARWRDAVQPMMAAPRSAMIFREISPEGEDGWRSAV